MANGLPAEVEFGGVWSAGMAYGSRELVERHLFSLYFMLPLVAVCLGFLYHNWYVAGFTHGNSPDLPGVGILPAPSLETRYAMSPAWHLQWWAFKHISQKRSSSFSFPKSSISFCRVLNCLGLFHVLDTGYQGMPARRRTQCFTY
jgi:hypothetical protein